LVTAIHPVIPGAGCDGARASPRISVHGIFAALAAQTLHVARLPAFAAARQGVRTQRRETLAAGFALAGLGGDVQPGATVARQ
jgi:hypothetical protein